ncbi:hypothetical protein EG830_11195, partial [bacterium]|nr:hypothetical protein [bacterium]
MGTVMIPKICHLIWTEGVPMSLLQSLTVKSFVRYNPGWKVIVHLITNHLPANTFTPDYAGEDFFHTITAEIRRVDLLDEGITADKHGILASDLLRCKLLYEIGGVYSDFDMLWLRPMSEFITDFETTMCWYDGPGSHWNQSNIVSEPGGPFLSEFTREQAKVRPPYSHQAFLTELLNRLYPNPQFIRERFPRVAVIPYKWFYPYGIYHLDQLYIHDSPEIS